MIALTTLLACGPGEEPAFPTSTAAAAARADGAAPFGAWPLCEPSALLPLDDGAWLVADNEGRPSDAGEPARPTLWVATDGGGRVSPISRPEAAQDAEALARLGDALWVFGSLSRNKDCEVKKKRWEVHVHHPAAFTAAGVATLATARTLARDKDDIAAIEGSVEGCRRVLFGGRPDGDALCAAIVEAARVGRPGACGTLNVEGAVAADGRLWVGLRAPLVAGRAALARLADDGTLSFDRVHLLDLGGLGVRELTVDGDRLYGIAGSVGDGDEPSRLFSAPLAGLATGELPVEVHAADLPSNAEAVHLGAEELRLLLDGDAGDGETCATAAGLLVRPR